MFSNNVECDHIIEATKLLLSQVPTSHLIVLHRLINLLADIASRESVTKLNPGSLAKCWGLNLITHDNPILIAQHMSQIHFMCEVLIVHKDDVF
jgi:RhoGAP domain